MAKQVLTNVIVTVGGTDISTYVAAVTLQTNAEDKDTTAMGSNGKTRIQGLVDSSVALSLFQDYPTIEKLFWDYYTAGTVVSVVIKPNGTAAASSTNPWYTFNALPVSWTAVGGAVGDVATADITWPISGTISKTGTAA